VVSTEKKSTYSIMTETINQQVSTSISKIVKKNNKDSFVDPEKKFSSIKDSLADPKTGKTNIDPNKSINESVIILDEKFFIPSKVIPELRDDPEVIQRLKDLDQASRQYMAFDMKKM
jgi:hypothetical protein